MSKAHSQPPQRVLLAGGTGLVGQQALHQLLVDPDVTEVRVLVRRPCTTEQLLGVQQAGSHKLRICVADFDHLAQHADWFAVDTVFCALGTTIKQAGSQAAFRQVDFDYPLQIAKLAKAQGAKRFLLVSALGAHPRSRVFYNRVKGELERAVRELGFDLVVAAQPSLLEGDRAQVRIGERIGLFFGFLMPERYKPVNVALVAAGLLASAKQARSGWLVLSNAVLRRMG